MASGSNIEKLPEDFNSGSGEFLKTSITSQEVEQLQNALKCEDFRRLLIEYTHEINDPNNLARREAEIKELEIQHGKDINEPNELYVMKCWTKEKAREILVNICTSPAVGEPISEGDNEKSWRIPYVPANHKLNFDEEKDTYDVVDIIFNSKTLERASNSAAFQKLLTHTALEATEMLINTQLDKSKVKFPNLKYKGKVHKYIVKTVTPEHELTYKESSSLGVKTAIVVKIKLPLVESSADCELTVSCTKLKLFHNRYSLAINLPCKVKSDDCKAMFDKNCKILSIDLPINEFNLCALNIPLADNSLNNIITQHGNLNNAVGSLTTQCSSLKIDNQVSLNSMEAVNEITETKSDVACSDLINSNCNTKKPCTSMQNNEANGTQASISMLSASEDPKLANKNDTYRKMQPQYHSKMRSFSESSDDWSMSPCPSKGILKSYSLSSEMAQSLECAAEEEETACSTSTASSSVKKSVSFSGVISKQLYRADSSILGQRKKNQRKARNKRKNNSKRQNSESEDVCSESETYQSINSVTGGLGAKGIVKVPSTEFTTDLMFDIDM